MNIPAVDGLIPSALLTDESSTKLCIDLEMRLKLEGSLLFLRVPLIIDSGKRKGLLLTMKQMHIRFRPREGKAVRNFLFSAFFFSLAFFFANPACAQVAQSPFSLVGTIQSDGMGGAVLQDTTGTQSFYRLYEKLPDGSQIVGLRDDSISLKTAEGAVYDMYISHGAKTASSKSSSGQFTPTAVQQEIVDRQKQRMLDRARRNSEMAE
jgi:hypothetical protein